MPKVDITLMGFSFFNQNTRNGFPLKFKIIVNESDHCEMEIQIKQTDMDKVETNTFLIELDKNGINQVEISAGTKFHILIKTWELNYTDGYYGYGQIESNSDPVNASNEDDFTVESSSHSQTNKSNPTYGMVPYIYYAK